MVAAAPDRQELKEKAMHHPTTHRTTRTTHRSQRPSLSPYVLDDTALTLSEIRQARSEGEVTARR